MPGEGGAGLSEKKQPGGEVVRVDFGASRASSSTPPTAESVVPSPHDGEKLAVFTRMIDRGLVMVTLDARAQGVHVPEWLATEPQLALNFSHRFGIADFDYDERGVRASLSFSGHDVFCDVPWAAVWMMRSHVDGELAISPESVPPEIQEALAQASEELEKARGPKEDDSQRPRTGELALPMASKSIGLRSSAGDGSRSDDDGNDDPKPPGGLRLVKG